MKNLSSWLIAIFAFMFWGYRVLATVLYSMGKDFVLTPINLNIEIVLLFITFICICFITRRKLIPTIIYLLSHIYYYGIYIYNNIFNIASETATLELYSNLLVCLVAIAIPVAAFFDVLLDKNRKANPVDKQTDWFYKNKDYDRKLDERADKNQYRSL